MKTYNQIEKTSNNRIIVIDDDPDVWEAYKAILAPQQLEGKFIANNPFPSLRPDRQNFTFGIEDQPADSRLESS